MHTLSNYKGRVYENTFHVQIVIKSIGIVYIHFWGHLHIELCCSNFSKQILWERKFILCSLRVSV